MVSAYINSHLIGPASLKYIISGTLQEDRITSPNYQADPGVPKHSAQRWRRKPVSPVSIPESFMASNVGVCQR